MAGSSIFQQHWGCRFTVWLILAAPCACQGSEPAPVDSCAHVAGCDQLGELGCPCVPRFDENGEVSPLPDDPCENTSHICLQGHCVSASCADPIEPIICEEALECGLIDDLDACIETLSECVDGLDPNFEWENVVIGCVAYNDACDPDCLAGLPMCGPIGE